MTLQLHIGIASPMTLHTLCCTLSTFSNIDNDVSKKHTFDYLIGQHFGGQNFRWTKFSAPSWNFGSFVRRNFFIGFLFPHTIHEKIFLNMIFVIIWHVLDFSGQNISADKIFGNKSDFRLFCPPKICPIRYFIDSHTGDGDVACEYNCHHIFLSNIKPGEGVEPPSSPSFHCLLNLKDCVLIKRMNIAGGKFRTNWFRRNACTK